LGKILAVSFVFKYSIIAFIAAVGLPIGIPWLIKLCNSHKYQFREKVESTFTKKPTSYFGLCFLLLVLITIITLYTRSNGNITESVYDDTATTFQAQYLIQEVPVYVESEIYEAVDPAYSPKEGIIEPERIFAGLRGASPYFVTDVDFGDGDFPILRIYTEENIIDRNYWISASLSLCNAATEEYEFEGVEARIRGRGHSSWNWDKPSFRIRFSDAQPMLDSGHSARDWTFIANHFDNSLMRNYSAYYLASLLDGMYVAPFARFVDVYFNGEYQGVYMLSIQHSYIVDGQVYLQYDTNPAVSEFLLELDSRVRRQGGTEFEDFILVNGRSYELRYPSGHNLAMDHARYAQNFLYRVEVLLMLRDETVFELIHKPSFVDFYIISELYKDVDVGFSSVFMQIRGQGNNRRLEMGPVWDQDRSLGNDNRAANLHVVEYHARYPYGIQAAESNHWFFYLMEIPAFFSAVTERWNDIKYDQVQQMMSHVENMARTYEASFERNFFRWPILGEQLAMQPQTVGEIDTFMGHVDFILDFLDRRIVWLDEYFNSRYSRNPKAPTFVENYFD